MKRKQFITFWLFLIFLSFFPRATHAQYLDGITPVLRPADFENFSAPDSNGYRIPLKMPGSQRAAPQLLPYPIIFIHGLNSFSDVWNPTTDFMDSQYGLTYGGRFDFCLNYDGNNAIANTNFYSTLNADIALFLSSLYPPTRGDYYYVNFDVGINGVVHPDGNSYDVISNQQAIVKQGKALGEAIYRVLQLTGRNKVILMGHSMGGLAAREYIQNSIHWQPDGQHHVAKLVTTGTPHGGSNQFGLTTLFGHLPDSQSEAVRDLRTSYTYSQNNGVYLFGGIENLAYMEDQLLYYFYNADVNCNGASGNTITGLNQKNIYTNLDYSCITGECIGCGGSAGTGDGIVKATSANLKNYYSSLPVNTFSYQASALVEIHTDLPKQNIQNMQGLDEPDQYSLAYEIKLDTQYIGFVTLQSANNAYYPQDYDQYKFQISSNGIVNVSVGTIIIASNFTVNIRNSSQQIVATAFHAAGSTQSINISKSASAGSYYLEIIGEPTASSYLVPYDFQLSFSACSQPVANFSHNVTGNNVSFTNLSQNAQTYNWSFGDGGTSGLASPTHSYATTGTYTVNLTSTNSCGTNTTSKTVFVGCQALTAGFTYQLTGGTVQFTNTSQNASGFNWNFGDGSGSVTENPSHHYIIEGIFDVTLTVSNACSTQTITQTVTILPSKIEEDTEGAIVTIYPNPAKDWVNISGEGLKGWSLILTNAIGEVLLTTQLRDDSFALSTSEFETGVYCISLNYENARIFRRLLIIK